MAGNTDKPKWGAQIASLFSALVATISCPLCIPGLGAFLASIGLGLAVVAFLRPLLIGLLLLSLASFAWSVRLHKQWWVLAVAVIGAFGIYAGKYIWFNQGLMYAGVFLLIGTSLINFRLKISCGCK